MRYNTVNMRRVTSRLADFYARCLQNFQLQPNFDTRNKTLMLRPQIQSCLSRSNVVPTTRENLEINPTNARDLGYITAIHTPSVSVIPLSCLRYASQHVDEIHKHPTQLSSIAQIPKYTHIGHVAASELSKFHLLKYLGKVGRCAIYCDLFN